MKYLAVVGIFVLVFTFYTSFWMFIGLFKDGSYAMDIFRSKHLLLSILMSIVSTIGFVVKYKMAKKSN